MVSMCHTLIPGITRYAPLIWGVYCTPMVSLSGWSKVYMHTLLLCVGCIIAFLIYTKKVCPKAKGQMGRNVLEGQR